MLDDIDARPGSTRLAAADTRRSVPAPARRLDLGGRPRRARGRPRIEAGPARTGITRLKQKGLLLAERDAGIGYRLNPAAVGMLERGDRRIFEMREMTDADPWCLISFSIPESARSIRHQLRRRLQWIGAGVVSPALWIWSGASPGGGGADPGRARRPELGDPVPGVRPRAGRHARGSCRAVVGPRGPARRAPRLPGSARRVAVRAVRRLRAADRPLAGAAVHRPRASAVDASRPDWPGRRSFEEFARLSAALAAPSPRARARSRTTGRARAV